MIALQPVITGKYIGRQIATGQVAQVQRAVGIGPGDADENTFRQGKSSCRKNRVEFRVISLVISYDTDYVTGWFIIT